MPRQSGGANRVGPIGWDGRAGPGPLHAEKSPAPADTDHGTGTRTTRLQVFRAFGASGSEKVVEEMLNFADEVAA